MKTRTLIPGASKNATNLDQLQADVPQYGGAPTKPGEAAMISVPSMAQFKARQKSPTRSRKIDEIFQINRNGRVWRNGRWRLDVHADTTDEELLVDKEYQELIKKFN